MKNVLYIFNSLGLCCLLLLGGCSATPATKFYTLTSLPKQSSQSDNTANNHVLSVSISAIKFPDFLDRPQIVTRPGPNQLAIAEFHRWGGSLANDFQQVLGENLAILLGTERIFYPRQAKALPIDYRLSLNVKAFEGKLGEEILLDVDWIVIDPRHNNAAVMQNTFIREPVTQANYESFVAAQSQALAKLSRQIANFIRQSITDSRNTHAPQ